MVETTLENARKYGMFVHEMRCPCPDNELKATKFTKMKIKYTDEGRRKLCWFVLAISIVAFVALSVLLIIHYFIKEETNDFLHSPKVTMILGFLAWFLITAIFTISVLLCCPNSCFECKHTALELLYNCDSCGHNVHKTYECFVHSSSEKNHTYYYNQTDNPWGRYTAQNATKKVLQKPSATTTFERVERKFKLMSGDKMNNYTTSWAWTNDLMSRLD
ncbi:hypothetical protein niasHS_004369 [Heterodera schachtii]|uniref:Uncharacterized protein n=1 Tax=Heterodera schachtii TaxID=97005 RepID=A0ABD2K0Q9_HETSC